MASPDQYIVAPEACNTNPDLLPRALYSLLYKVFDSESGVLKTNAVLNGAVVSATNPLPCSDAGAAWTSSRGVSGVPFTSADASGGVAAVSDAPTSTKHLVVTDVLISVDTNMRVDLKEETSDTVLASIYMAANTAQQFTFRSPIKLPTADKKLTVQTSVPGNIAVTASYYSI